MAADIVISNNTGTQALFSSDDQRMIVQPGVVVSDSGAPAVYTNYDNDQLLNHGFIFSGLRGVLFEIDADDGLVRNFADGVIMAPDGVEMRGAHSSVVNDGDIVGFNGYGVKIENATKGAVTNSGSIAGEEVGVYFAGGGTEGHTLRNTGLVRAQGTAVGVDINPAGTVTVSNAAGAKILGDFAIEIYQGELDLTNHGVIVGVIIDYIGRTTTVRNDGRLDNITYLGGGADSFNGARGIQDEIYAGAGTDRVIGGARADWMDGGADRDVLTGGRGADRFHLSDLSDSAPGPNRDIITDFRHGDHDKIDLHDLTAFPFVFRGAGSFLGVGLPSVRFTKENKPGTAHDRTIVHGDVNGDGVTDFQIELKGLVALKAADFDL